MGNPHSPETTLSVNESQFRALFKSNPIPIYLWQQQQDNFILIDYNDAAEVITKSNISKLLNQTVDALYQDQPDIIANTWACFKQKSVIKQPASYQLLNTDETKTFMMSYVFVPPDLVMIHTEDLTEYKQVESSLRQSESRLAEAQQIAKMGNWEWNLVTNKLYWSDEIYHIFGREPQQFKATYHAFLDAIHPQDRERVTTAIDLALTRQVPYNIDHRIVLPNGQIKVVNEQGNIIFNPQNQPIRMAGVVQDITERKQMEADLKESQQKFRALLDAASEGIVVVNGAGRIALVNVSAQNMFGYQPDEILGQSIEVLLPERFRNKHINHRMNFVNNPPSQVRQMGHNQDLVGRHKSGTEFFIAVGLNTIKTKDETLTIAVVQDVTERKQMERDLRIKDNAIASTLNGIALANLEGNLTYVNDSFLRLWGYNSRQEVLGKPATTFWREPEKATTVVQALIDDDHWRGELTACKKDGSEINMQLVANMITNKAGQPIAMMASFTDITARKQIEEQLKASLQEKEVLLKEIHHRVKNNLQVISSLLDLQSSYIEDEYAQNIFYESQNRIRSMSLAHEWLYQTDTLVAINFADYINTLSGYLLRVFDKGNVEVQQAIAPVYFSLETAIPCGLIINELLSNTLKYAFPHYSPADFSAGASALQKTCRINIELHVKPTTAAANIKQFSLLVKDNGVGLPLDFDIKRSASLGLTLVVTLVKQLKGSMEIRNQDGAEFRIIFTDSTASIAENNNDKNKHTK